MLTTLQNINNNIKIHQNCDGKDDRYAQNSEGKHEHNERIEMQIKVKRKTQYMK